MVMVLSSVMSQLNSAESVALDATVKRKESLMQMPSGAMISQNNSHTRNSSHTVSWQTPLSTMTHMQPSPLTTTHSEVSGKTLLLQSNQVYCNPDGEAHI